MAANFIPVYADQKTVETEVPGWKTMYNDADGGAYVDTTVAHGGKASMKLVNNTPYAYNHYIRANYALKLTPGKTYKIKFFAKVRNGSMINVALGSVCRKSLLPLSGSYDWTPFEFTYTHELSTPEINFFFVIDDVTGALWVDDIEIYEYGADGKTGDNLISNGDFETITDGSRIIGNAEINSEADELPADSVSYIDPDEFDSHIPIYRKDGINIDGNLSEWDGLTSFHEPKNENQYQILMNGVKAEITAEMKYCYDDEYFYFSCAVNDKTHFTVLENYWQGDSLQIAIGTKKDNYGTELGFMYNEKEGSSVHGSSDSGIKFCGSRSGSTTIYEIAIPWSLKFDKCPDEFLFCAVINNNDGGGRAYGLELAPGIFNEKTNKDFPTIHTVKKGSEYVAFLQGSAQEICGSEILYSLYIVNNGADKSFTVEGPKSNSLELKSGQAVKIDNAVKCDKVGIMPVVYKINDGSTVQEIGAEINILPNREITAEMIEQHKKQTTELDGLIAECEKRRLSTDYEKLYRNVIDRFTGYMEDELELDCFVNINYYHEELGRLYNEAADNLRKYLNNEKQPPKVPKFVTGDVTIDGQSIIATTDANGVIEKRPVFLYGYGHWDQVKDEVEKMPDFGASFIQTDSVISNLLVEASAAKGWFQRTQFDVDGDIMLDSSTAASGKTSLKMVRRGPYKVNDLLCFFQEIEAKPGVTYEFGLKAKGQGVKSTWFGFGPAKKVSRISMDGTYDWKEYKGTYTVGKDDFKYCSNLYSVFPDAVSYHAKEDFPRIRLVIQCEGETSGINIDDIYVREKGSDVNLLENGSFERGAPENAKDGYMYDGRVLKYLEDMLERAEKNNVRVDLGLNLYSINQLLTYKYYKNVDIKGLTWSLNYDILNPDDYKVLKGYEYHIRTIARLAKKYKSVNSICMTNETKYYSWKSSSVMPYWTEYVRNKYGDISDLNNVYHTSYKSFEEVILPTSSTPDESIGGLVVFNDWRDFNEDVLSGFHKWIAGIIKEEAPNVLVHAKMCANLFPSDAVYRSFMTDGTSPEKYAEWSDLNGNDAGNKIENRDITKTMMFYNLQTSIKSAPVINSENHVLFDNDMNINTAISDNADANLWQGAVNGMGATAMWIWDRAEGVDPSKHIFGTQILNRPDLVARIGKTNYDLNRLSYEVTALQKQKADVAMLYSVNSRAYENAAMGVMFKAYEATIFNGKKVDFIVDSQPQKLENHNFLIVPYSTNVPDETLRQIKALTERGGTVVILGEESLCRNEYGAASDAETLKYIKEHAIVIPITHGSYEMTSPGREELKQRFAEILSDKGMNTVVVKNAKTGEPLRDVTWQSTFYNNKLLVNVCSYDYDSEAPIEAVIEVNGKPVTGLKELRSGTEYENKFTVKLLTPLIFEADCGYKYFDTVNHWANNDINALTDKSIVNGRTQGYFEPDGFVTVGELAKMLCCILKLDTGSQGNSFDDVLNDDWYAPYINAADKLGLLDGIKIGGLSRANDCLTREEAAHMLVRAAELKTGKALETGNLNFADKNDIGENFSESVNKAAKNSFIEGFPNGEFKPKKNVTRAECCRMILNVPSLAG